MTITSTGEIATALRRVAATKEFETLISVVSHAGTTQLKETAVLDLIKLLGQTALSFADPTP